MAITNTKVVDSTEKYIVQSKGIGGEEDQIVADAEELESGNNAVSYTHLTLPTNREV